ncbi:MAG: hypothetical protein PHE61_03230 [Candidatus Omnitrophica bacterium]|nr:hypothetical protein [Candidatus Omnitrophota bacterium]
MKRVFGVLCFILTLAVVFQVSDLYAVQIIANRTGAIRIEYPDGTTDNVGIDEDVNNLPSGSTVYALDSSMTVAPVDGWIKVVVGPSVATVKAGDGITVRYDENNSAACFHGDRGQVSVVTGDTTTLVNKNEDVEITLNVETGIPEVHRR